MVTLGPGGTVVELGYMCQQNRSNPNMKQKNKNNKKTKNAPMYLKSRLRYTVMGN